MMPDFRHAFHHPDSSIEDRFLAWTDRLVDPESGAPAPPDGDFADAAETASTVQRCAGLGASMPLPPARSEAIWKDLTNMSTTNTATYPLTIAGRDSAAPGSTTRHRTASTAGWRNYLTTAALIAAILIASIATIWRINDPFNGGSDDPGPAQQPGITGSATPAAETAGGCPLTSDMPIFVGEAPFLGGVEGLDPTIAVVEPDGDFGLLCSPLEEPEPLVTGVTDAASLPWPGTVLLELEDGSAIAYNVSDDRSIALGDFDVVSRNPAFVEGSQFFLSPNNEAFTDWRITNLERMQSITLSDEIGGVLNEAVVPSLVWSPRSLNAVVSFRSWFEPSVLPPNTANATIAELPENALVVDASFETRRGIDDWGEVAISRDGDTIAYQTQIDLVPMIRVEDTLSGNVLAEFTDVNFNAPRGPRFAFAGDDESLVYLSDNDVWLADYRDGQSATLLETGDMRPSSVYPTGVPGRVLIEQVAQEPVTDSRMNAAASLAILDTSTSTVTDVEGVVPTIVLFPGGPNLRINYVVTVRPSSENEAMTTVQLTDIATGDVVLTSDPLKRSVRTLLDSSGMNITSDASGRITVFSVPGMQSVYFNVTTDTAALIDTDQLSNIERFSDFNWNISTTSDGRYLYAFGRVIGDDRQSPSEEEWFSTSLLSSDPQWSVPTDNVPTGLIIGIPPDDPDEPRALDAQEITPLEASPVATPIAEAYGCDVTRDILVLDNGDAPAWDRTIAVLADGTLTLECDRASTVVAEGVASVEATGWPGALIATMDEGTLRGINLLTGATGDFGPASVLTESVSSQSGVSAAPGTPWAAVPANREVTDWRIIDLRTMESILLSDEIGGVLPGSTPALPYAYTPDVLVVGFSGRLPTDRSVGFSGRLPTDRSAPPGILTSPPTAPPSPPESETVGELPSQHAALVIDGSLGNRHWTEVSNRTMMSAAISPDGVLLAVEQTLDDGFTVRVERLSDGELVADTGIELNASDSYLVVDDEAGLLHLSEDRLDLVTWSPELATETLLEFDSGQQPFILTQTSDPDVSLMTLLQADGTLTGYLINTKTGEIINVPGLIQSQFQLGYSDGTPPQHVLAAVPNDVDNAQTTIQLIDVTSGDSVAESDPVDAAPDDAAVRGTMGDGAESVGMAFYPDGRAIILDSATGESMEIDAPIDAEGMPGNAVWYFFPGADGSYVTVTPDFGADSPRVFIRQLDPDADWIELPADALLGFIPGTGTLPDATPAP